MFQAQRLFLFVAIMWVSVAAAATDLPIPNPPSLGAKTDILVDYNSGQVLAAKDPDKQVAPASITKLMTCYIVFDQIKKGNIKPSDVVTVSKKAWEIHGSQMFLRVGNKITVDLLLQGLITDSGNDAAVQLAQDVAGTTSAFTGYMNQYAKQLGMNHTHFMDVNGLPHPKHYMSARDIATLYAAIVREFPKLYDQYFHQKEMTYSGIKQYNRNTLLWSDPRVDGGKTGHTKEAGYNLAASAKSNGMRLICVVTGTDSEDARASQCEALLSYGFHFFKNGTLYSPGDQITQVKVYKGAQDKLPVVVHDPVVVAYPRGERKALKNKAALPSHLTAPVKKGTKLGTLSIEYNGKPLQKAPLYAGASVAEGSYISQLIDQVMSLLP